MIATPTSAKAPSEFDERTEINDADKFFLETNSGTGAHVLWSVIKAHIASWIAGLALTAQRFVSTVSTGTAPFSVASTTKVTNLNADLLDGVHAGNASGNVPLSNGTVNTNLNADTVDGVHASEVVKNSVVSPVKTQLEIAVNGGTYVIPAGIYYAQLYSYQAYTQIEILVSGTWEPIAVGINTQNDNMFAQMIISNGSNIRVKNYAAGTTSLLRLYKIQ